MNPSGESRVLRPAGWAAPVGYTDGVVASGRMAVLAGQIGWNPATAAFETDDLVAQVTQALRNVVTLLAEAGAAPQNVVRLTWFVVNRDEYATARRAIGAAYRSVMGDHYPPMTLVVVSALLEPRAKVEIEATAVLA